MEKSYLILMALALVMPACQSANTTFSRPNPIEETLDKVMVIALTNQYSMRDMWEKEMAYRLKRIGYNTITSIGIDPSYTKLYTREELEEIIKDQELDGVLALRLKDIDRKEGYTQSDRYISDPYGGQIYMFNYLDPYMNLRGWQYKIDQKVTIEGRLYETASEKLLLDAESHMTNAESEEALAGEITESLAKAISRSKILVKHTP